MAQGICVNRLDSGKIDNIRVDHGNGMVIEVDAKYYIRKGVLPDCNELPDCRIESVGKDDEGE